MLGSHRYDQSGSDRTNARRARLDVDDRHLAEPISRTEHGDPHVSARLAFFDHFQLARDHHEHLRGEVAFFHDHLSRFDPIGRQGPSQHLEGCVAQSPEKTDVGEMSGSELRRGWRTHDFSIRQRFVSVMESNWIDSRSGTHVIDSDQPRSFGSYVLLRRLGAGGMAEVYLGKACGDAGFEKLVAIKLLSAQSGAGATEHDMLAEEAKLSAVLRHPNIVRTFDLAFIDGACALVMEHVDGCDLQSVIDGLQATGRLFPIDLAAHVTAEVCDALDYAHRAVDAQGNPAGVVHRDISPPNVLLSRAGEVKIADFGVAKTDLRPSDPDLRVVQGKYCYMSPEQVQAAQVDGRSDVYSVGIVLWELLAGRRLRQQSDIGALLRAVRRADVPPPSVLRAEVPAALDSIVARATARDRRDRYPDAASMADALRRYLKTRPAIHPARCIGELLAALPLEGTAAAPERPAGIPQTRGRAWGLAAHASSDATDGRLRGGLLDAEPTVSGRRSPGPPSDHRAWPMALAAGLSLVGFVLWWLHAS